MENKTTYINRKRSIIYFLIFIFFFSFFIWDLRMKQKKKERLTQWHGDHHHEQLVKPNPLDLCCPLHRPDQCSLQPSKKPYTNQHRETKWAKKLGFFYVGFGSKRILDKPIWKNRILKGVHCTAWLLEKVKQGLKRDCSMLIQPEWHWLEHLTLILLAKWRTERGTQKWK